MDVPSLWLSMFANFLSDLAFRRSTAYVECPDGCVLSLKWLLMGMNTSMIAFLTPLRRMKIYTKIFCYFASFNRLMFSLSMR